MQEQVPCNKSFYLGWMEYMEPASFLSLFVDERTYLLIYRIRIMSKSVPQLISKSWLFKKMKLFFLQKIQLCNRTTVQNYVLLLQIKLVQSRLCWFQADYFGPQEFSLSSSLSHFFLCTFSSLSLNHCNLVLYHSSIICSRSNVSFKSLHFNPQTFQKLDLALETCESHPIIPLKFSINQFAI